eukprot:7887228-Pyramimonas_sp.AAC.1
MITPSLFPCGERRRESGANHLMCAKNILCLTSSRNVVNQRWAYVDVVVDLLCPRWSVAVWAGGRVERSSLHQLLAADPRNPRGLP